MREHHFDSAQNPQREFRVGSVGTDCTYNAPYLQASLTITDAEAIRKIESGERVELSCSYFYKTVAEKGKLASDERGKVCTMHSSTQTRPILCRPCLRADKSFK